MFDFFLSYFESIPPSQRTLLLVVGLAFFWLLEGRIPLFSFEYRRIRHALVNGVFWTTTLLINLAFAALIVAAARWSAATNFGIVRLVDMPAWLSIVVGLLLLDLIGAWFIHWLEHRIKWMWKFHLIHHSDREVDVTTGLRHHPGEAVFRAVFTLLAVLISGASIATIFLYQSLSALFAQLTHANVNSPEKLDRALSWIFVTPNMHKVHHHYVQPMTDTNYGNIFSIWDRLFGTFAEVDTKSLVYGIDTHMNPEESERLDNLMAIPFQRYRPPEGAKFWKSESARGGDQIISR